MPRRAVVAALLSVPLAVLLAACGGANAGPAAQSAPAAVSEPTATTGLPLGTSVTWEGVASGAGGAVVTLHGIDRGAPSELPELEPGKLRTALDIEACATGPNVGVSGARWSVMDASNGRYTSDSYSVNPVLPQYPDNPVELLPGDCLRGWLVMDVPQGTALTTVRYAPVGTDGRIAATFEWDVPA